LPDRRPSATESSGPRFHRSWGAPPLRAPRLLGGLHPHRRPGL